MLWPPIVGISKSSTSWRPSLHLTHRAQISYTVLRYHKATFDTITPCTFQKKCFSIHPTDHAAYLISRTAQMTVPLLLASGEVPQPFINRLVKATVGLEHALASSRSSLMVARIPVATSDTRLNNALALPWSLAARRGSAAALSCLADTPVGRDRGHTAPLLGDLWAVWRSTWLSVHVSNSPF